MATCLFLFLVFFFFLLANLSPTFGTGLKDPRSRSLFSSHVQSKGSFASHEFSEHYPFLPSTSRRRDALIDYNEWVSYSSTGQNPPGCSHGASYVVDNRYFYILGGLTIEGSNVPDIWFFDTVRLGWSQIEHNDTWPLVGSGVIFGTMVYEGHTLLVVTGGFSQLQSIYLNDVLYFNLTSTTWVNTTTSQTSASRFKNSYDAAGVTYDHYMIMFGGIYISYYICNSDTPRVNSTIYGDTWVWNLADASYTKLNVSLGPSPRWSASMAVLNATVYLLGGIQSLLTCANDYQEIQEGGMWSMDVSGIGSDLSLLRWVFLPTINTPVSVGGSLFAAKGMLFSVGFTESYRALQDSTCVFDPATSIWYVRNSTSSLSYGNIPPRIAAFVAPFSDYILLFGGSNYLTSLSDLWLLEISDFKHPLWFQSPAASMPPSRIYHMSCVWRDSVIVIGGFDGDSCLGDVWSLNTTTGKWVEVLSSLDVMANLMLASLHTVDPVPSDPRQVFFLIFGGSTESSATSAVSVYHPLNRTYSLVPPQEGSLVPPPSFFHHAAGNSTHMYIFGGANWNISAVNGFFIQTYSTGYFWVYEIPSNTWVSLNASLSGTHPLPRFAHGLAFYPPTPQPGSESLVYLFGGRDSGDVKDDAWVYRPSTGRWLEVTALLGLPIGPRYGFSLSPLNDSLVFMGGSQDIPLLPQFPIGTSNPGDIWVLTPLLNMSSPALDRLYGAGGNTSAQNYTQGAWMNVSVGSYEPREFHTMAVLAGQGTLIPLGGFEGSVASFATLSELVSISLACNIGTYSPRFPSTPCIPCEKGKYSAASGASSCQVCPSKTFTPYTGSPSPLNCSVCTPGYCYGTGSTCAVDLTSFTVTCTCPFYLTGPRCEIQWGYITVFCVVGFLVLATVLFCSYRHLKGKVRHLERYSQLREDTLTSQLRELQDYWVLKPSEFRFVKKLDEGAYGEVFMAYYGDEIRAVKKLKRAIIEYDESVLKEFAEEASFFRSLRHPNIVQFYGWGEMEDSVEGGYPIRVPFLVTEFMSLGSLKGLLHDHEFLIDASLRVKWALDAARGMAYLHEHNKIHRDLKSGNLLVNERKTVKVSDFGTSRLVSNVAYGTSPPSPSSTMGDNKKKGDKKKGGLAEPLLGQRVANPPRGMTSPTLTSHVGTLLWSSPEVLRGDPYGLAADVYSYGIVLWEISYRDMPFSDVENLWDVRNRVLSGGRPHIGDDVDPAFAALMRACWQDSPSLRPSFSDILAVIEPLSPLPVFSPPSPAHDPTPLALKSSSDPVFPPPTDLPSQKNPAVGLRAKSQ